METPPDRSDVLCRGSVFLIVDLSPLPMGTGIPPEVVVGRQGRFHWGRGC